LEAFLVSTAVVALGELGDKTQLLALMLAARYPRPWPIVAGIFVATLLNHAFAGSVGALVRTAVPEHILKWLLAISFFAVAAWALKPDKLDEAEAPPSTHWGVFGVTTDTRHDAGQRPDCVRGTRRRHAHSVQGGAHRCRRAVRGARGMGAVRVKKGQACNRDCPFTPT